MCHSPDDLPDDVVDATVQSLLKEGTVGERSRNSKNFLRITKIYLWRDQQRVEGECIYIPL